MRALEFREIQRSEFALWKQMRGDLYTSLDDSYHVQEMEEIANRADWFCYFVVSDDGEIIGLLELSSRNIVDGCVTSPVAYLEGLYLKQGFRGQGYGRSVLEKVVNWCRDNGYTELATDTELDNEGAQRFYTSFGFAEGDRVVAFRMAVNKEQGTGSRI